MTRATPTRATPTRAAWWCATLWILACATLTGIAPNARAAPSGPIAVMPFKNLNQDGELRWLTVGIAETMIADLRKVEAVQVVERDQLDRALAELALQGGPGGEVSQAVQAGKLLGAKTMVLGSFQRAGKQLRIVARFVAVETGLVQDTAKVTGGIGRIFHLQDQIVARLLGRRTPSKRREAKRARSAAPKTIKAYELYAMSLTTSSKVERVQFLKASLEVDPDFSYALEDLDALERRMQRYERAAQQERGRQADAARRLFEQADLPPQQRSQAAFALLTNHMTGFRYRALLADARLIRTLDLPPYGTVSVREFASFAEFQSHMMLKQHDLALQIGERHLAEFPGGTYYTSVESSMRSTMRTLRQRESGKKQAQLELARIEEERTEALAEATEQRPAHPARLQGLDFQRCSTMQRNHQYEEAIRECRAFAKKYRSTDDDDARELVLMARYMVVLCLAEEGRFADARAQVAKLGDDAPEFVDRMSMKTIAATWPR